MKQGTPSTLNQAIYNGLDNTNPDINIRDHVKDFLAQKFSIAFAKAELGQDAEDILEDLWEDIKKEVA